MARRRSVAYKARRRQRHHDKLAALRAGGACCGSCSAWEAGVCSFHSDFHGACRTDARDLCEHFVLRAA
jgi:hypothetical protein